MSPWGGGGGGGGEQRQKHPFETVVKTLNCLLVINIPAPAVAVISG